MSTFAAPDGTTLAYRTLGHGPVLVCLPGGPMADPAYLGDLGGLSGHRQLVLPDLRGTGHSAVPADPSSYRADRQVEDVEALRAHLRIDRLDLLGHSAGTNLAVLYAARYPHRVARLVLVTPSPWAVGIRVDGSMRRDVALLRQGEPWFEPAYAAFQAIVAGTGGAAEWAAMTPFSYGRWDAAAQAHDAAQTAAEVNDEAAARYGEDGVYEPAETNPALRRLNFPVLVIAGEWDMNTPPAAATEIAGLFAHAELVVQAGAGHYPWVDDARTFVSATAEFLGEAVV